ncbi:ABC transporter substrate-binding protein [Wukongibacter sp. M2B1]|uniref:ABC transporter substrate-binding protein n=1 Tax=Wukongibacter sp. M2B1 TaxID=3088895 RepID=UPI003D7BA506
MKKLSFIAILILVLSLSFTGCSGNDKAETEQETKAVEPSTQGTPKEEVKADGEEKYEPLTFNYEIYGEKYEVVFEKAPERAVTLSQFMTEMLLALGLEDKMVGTAYMDNEIYPEFKEAYEGIEILSDKYPSKEVLFSVEPDFVSGWTSAFNEKRVASASEMMENGIHPYLATAIGGNGSLEAVYQDFRDLAKIFEVEEKGEEVINKMKAEVKAIQDKIGEISEAEMVKVFAFDSGETEPFVVSGGGVSGDIIRLAKGKNIFGEIEKGYATVSWEEVVAKQPDVIVIVDYGDTDYETKLNFLKDHPALKDLKAVKEERFVKIGLADMSPGVRNTKAIEELAKGFYPDKFE